MGRPWRIEYPGALYHVLSRGNERRDIFFNDADCRMFLKTLGEMADRFDVEVFAYVLMPNHYHLLIKTHHANLSKTMQWFGVTYTNRFNTRHTRSGHLFQGRFKSILVQNDAYLVQLSYYIHRNPLRTGIIKRLADYRWSSYLPYAYGRKAPGWLSMDLILSFYKAEDQHRAYREKVQRYANEEKRLWEDLRHGIFLGSIQFVDEMKKKYLPQTPHREIPQQKAVIRPHNPQKMLQKAAKLLGCNPERFKQAVRIPASDRDDRDILVYFIWQKGMVTNESLARLFGLTYSSISHIVKKSKKRLDEEEHLRKKIEILYSQFKI
jgi:putative transposase